MNVEEMISCLNKIQKSNSAIIEKERDKIIEHMSALVTTSYEEVEISMNIKIHEVIKKLRVLNGNNKPFVKHTSTPIAAEKRYNQTFQLNCEFIDCEDNVDMDCSGIQDRSKSAQIEQPSFIDSVMQGKKENNKIQLIQSKNTVMQATIQNDNVAINSSSTSPASFESCLENDVAANSSGEIEMNKQKLTLSTSIEENCAVNISSDEFDFQKQKSSENYKKKKYTCYKCKKIFKLKQQLNSHINYKHKAFKIKSIIDKRYKKGKIQYKVTWDGCELYESTWEPKETLEIDAADFVERIESAQNEPDEAGKRYCICNGLNNGLLMIQCTRCQKWFHTTCVEVDVMTVTKEEMRKKKWQCTKCTNNDFNSIVDFAINDDP